MSETATNAFHKVISDRQLLGRSLVGSLIAAIASAALLGGIVPAAGGLAHLVIADASFDSLRNEGFPIGLLSQLAKSVSLLNQTSSALTMLFGLLAILICVRVLLRSVIRGQLSRHVASAVNRLREHIQRQALRCNPGDLTGHQQSTAASIFQQTAQQLEENAYGWSYSRLTTCCDLIVLTALLFLVQWRVGLECVIPVVVCWYIVRMESERHEVSATLLTEQVDRELEKLTDHLNKSRIVAGYGMESLEHEHFSASLQNYQRRCESLRQQKARGQWTLSLIYGAMFGLPIVILARHLVFGDLLSVASAVSLAVIVGFITLCLHRIQNVAQMKGASTVAADSINQYLLRVPTVSQVVGAKFLEPMSRLLQFDQVIVETETQPDLLSNLDLKIEFGQRVAILSLDPHEAEALVTLIPRFTDPTGGQVLIDGQDIRRVTLESLRAEAVVVGGDEPVFNTTVLENITVGQADLTKQDAIEACKIAHAESFIRQLPKGYETHLGKHEALLDVGHRFRISLARAIARKPALLVIQEPDVLLDAETKAMLDDTYQRIGHDRTLLFIPTRLSTVKKCDRIVVIHQGRVEADGRHEELVRSSEIYRHWEYLRFNTFR